MAIPHSLPESQRDSAAKPGVTRKQAAVAGLEGAIPLGLLIQPSPRRGTPALCFCLVCQRGKGSEGLGRPFRAGVWVRMGVTLGDAQGWIIGAPLGLRKKAQNPHRVQAPVFSPRV